MSDEKSTREQYRHLRDEFDGMKTEDKALFLVEAAASTVARGLEDAGRTLAREIDDFFGRACGQAGDEPESEPERPRAQRHTAARPSSSEQQAPHRPYRDPDVDEGEVDEPGTEADV